MQNGDSRYVKCFRCKRPLLLSRAEWYGGKPYGEYCYERVKNVELQKSRIYKKLFI